MLRYCSSRSWIGQLLFARRISYELIFIVFTFLLVPQYAICVMNKLIPQSPATQPLSHQQEETQAVVKILNSKEIVRQNGTGETDLVSASTISKRNAIAHQNSRSFFSGNNGYGYNPGYNEGPFCYDRDVTGTCRYRMDPSECLSHEWTAYATIQIRGTSTVSLYSVPQGLNLHDLHGRERVRVFLKVSCCTPVIQFVSNSAWNTQGNSCVVDVREYQALHPGEIAGIVIGVVLLLIIIIVIIVVIVKRRRDRMPVLVGRAHIGSGSREHVSRQ